MEAEGQGDPERVRVRIRRAPGEKRRSWHASRVADDIQRSLSTPSAEEEEGGVQSPGSRFSWHPSGHDWPSPPTSYQAQADSAQVELPGGGGGSSPGPRFTIASWTEAHPTAPVTTQKTAMMDSSTEALPVIVHELDNGSLDGGEPSLRTPILPRSFVLSDDPDGRMDLPSSPSYNKHYVSSIADQYFEVVVRELRGLTPPSFFFPSIFPCPLG